MRHHRYHPQTSSGLSLARLATVFNSIPTGFFPVVLAPTVLTPHSPVDSWSSATDSSTLAPAEGSFDAENPESPLSALKRGRGRPLKKLKKDGLLKKKVGRRRKDDAMPSRRLKRIMLLLLPAPLATPLHSQPWSLGPLPLLALPFPDDESAGERRDKLEKIIQNGKFVEPALAPPKPGYSGFPLEAMPPQKLRLAAKQKRKTARRSPTPDETTDESTRETENSYIVRLKTRRLENLTLASKERLDIVPTRSKASKSRKRVTVVTPKTPGDENDRKRRRGPGLATHVKRIKITSPKKPALLLSPQQPALTPDSDDASANDDYCASCGGTGVFICCDSCPKSFHLLCCDPPLQDIPEDNWNCLECRAAQSLDGPPRLWNDVGLFGPLLNSLRGRNPVEFRLPKKLRDSTFVGVSSGPDYQYSDSLMKSELAVSKLSNGQIAGFNRDDDLDVDSLYDKNGRPCLCHKCHKLGLKRKKLVSCEYCPLRWHLDCLPDAVCLAKTLGLKWRCPNHVELLLPSFGLDRRQFREAGVVDVAIQNHFLKIAQALSFLIKNSDQPYIRDLRVPTLQEFVHYQKGDYERSSFLDRHKTKFGDAPDSDNEEDTMPEYAVPDFLQNYAIDGQIAAKASRKLSRILLMTNADDPDQQPFVYRVPERSVILDFVGHAKKRKEEVLQEMKNYELRARIERGQDDEAISLLVELRLNGPGENVKTDPEELSEHKAPDKESSPRETDSMDGFSDSLASSNSGQDIPSSSNSNGISDSSIATGQPKIDRPRPLSLDVLVSVLSRESTGDEDPTFDVEELKKLIERKGRDAVLDFLRS